jgi:predicted transcriptional regulator
MTGDVLLISIRPEYANKIFDGSKTVELRRVRPRLESGDWVLVYVSTPVQALVGMFQVDKVVAARPDHLWSLVRSRAGISREQFDLYYKGTELGYGIFLKITRQLPEPIYLGYLRQLLSGFHPPQSYRYITSVQASLIGHESYRFKRRVLLQQMPSAQRRD